MYTPRLTRSPVTVTGIHLNDSKDDGVTPIPAKDALERMGEFFLVGTIDDRLCTEVSQAMLRAALNVKGSKKPVFTLNINSPGGAWSSGALVTGVINRIKDMGISVNTYVMGEACSMATVLVQNGDKRFMDANASFMIHDASYSYFGNDLEHRDRSVEHQIVRGLLARAYSNRNTAGHNDPLWWFDNYLNGRDYFMSAQAALEYGLVDEVMGTPRA